MLDSGCLGCYVGRLRLCGLGRFDVDGANCHELVEFLLELVVGEPGGVGVGPPCFVEIVDA